ESLACLSVIAFDGAPVLVDWRRAWAPRIHAWTAGGREGGGFSGAITLQRREITREAWVLSQSTMAVVRVSAAGMNVPVAVSGQSLPDSIAELAFGRQPGGIEWRLGERDGTRWTASAAFTVGAPVVVELGRLRGGAGLPWMLALDGAVVPFEPAPRQGPAWRAAEMREDLVVASGALSFRGFSPGVPRLKMTVRFPAKADVGAREPLIVAGDPGRGDFLFVEYLEGNRFRLGWDHWGAPGRWSEQMDYEPGVAGTLEIEAPGWSDFSQPGEISLDLSVVWGNRPVWRAVVPCYPVSPDRFHVGHNPIGGSSCAAWFSGGITR
ncbi:MAG: hypothetical protein ACKPB0_17045, partial [Opitutaceae bacterium]